LKSERRQFLGENKKEAAEQLRQVPRFFVLIFILEGEQQSEPHASLKEIE